MRRSPNCYPKAPVTATVIGSLAFDRLADNLVFTSIAEGDPLIRLTLEA